MKILVLCYEYPPIGGGGGRVAQAIAGQLAARGHAVRVQTAALGTRSVRETVDGVEVFRTASLRQREDTCAVHEMGLFCATSFIPTLRHIAMWKPDVIHAHFAMPTGLLAWAAHSLTGVPYVLTAHLGDVPGGVPDQTDTLFRIVDPLARRVWENAAACTAVSTFVQELAERAYGRSVERILNGIDLRESAIRNPQPSGARQTAEGGPQGEGGAPSQSAIRPPHLVFVGRFNPQKNAPFLIDALARLRDLAWKLTMVGDGPDMPAVCERIEAHGLADRVRLIGWRKSADVHRLLADADILCMPSLSEGMPVAAVEALAHGLAIAGSDILGLRDVLEPGVNGIAAPVNDAAGYARGLRRLLVNADTLHAMQAASWEKARAFDLGAIAAQYERVLLSACGH